MCNKEIEISDLPRYKRNIVYGIISIVPVAAYIIYVIALVRYIILFICNSEVSIILKCIAIPCTIFPLSFGFMILFTFIWVAIWCVEWLINNPQSTVSIIIYSVLSFAVAFGAVELVFILNYSFV